MPLQELPDRRVAVDHLVPAEAAVLPPGDGQELIRHAGLLEHFVQTDGMAVRHKFVLVSMDGQDGGSSPPHVRQGRNTPGKFVPVGLAAEPGDGHYRASMPTHTMVRNTRTRIKSEGETRTRRKNLQST